MTEMHRLQGKGLASVMLVKNLLAKTNEKIYIECPYGQLQTLLMVSPFLPRTLFEIVGTGDIIPHISQKNRKLLIKTNV